MSRRNNPDPAAIRLQFPFFQGRSTIYFDNAATTHKPNSVIDSISAFYKHDYANIHRGIYRQTEKATRAYEEVRFKVAEFVGAQNAEEIVFTRGTTESINLVAETFVKPRVKEGKNIVVSALEHHANLIPWQQVLAKAPTTELRVIPINPEGDLVLESLSELIDSNTIIVAVNHISNALGTINPIQEIIDFAHNRGVPVLVDAAQSIGFLTTDVYNFDVDFLAFSGHKIYGPTGIGVLFGKKEWLEHMPPYQTGGEMIKYVTYEDTSFRDIPHRFEAGTPHIAGVMGLGASIDFIRNIDLGSIRKHSQQLVNYTLAALKKFSGCKIIGNPTLRGNIISFLMDNVHPHDTATILDQQNVSIRAGHHCTQPLMRLLEIPGTNRVSFGIYNTFEEVDKFIDALKKVKGILG